MEVAVKKEEKKKEKKTNYQLPSVWMKRCKHKPISPALSYIKNAHHPFYPDLPPEKFAFREGREQRKYAIQKIRIISIIMRKRLDPWKETGKAVGGDTLLLYLTRNTHISSILTSRSPLLYTHHPGRSKENSSLTRCALPLIKNRMGCVWGRFCTHVLQE